MKISVWALTNTNEENNPGFDLGLVGQIVTGKKFIFDPIARFCCNGTRAIIQIEFSNDLKTWKIEGITSLG